MFSLRNSSTIYVSQSCGNNKNSGLSPTQDAYGNGPVKTLGYALYILSNIRGAGETRPLTISLVDDFYINHCPIKITKNMGPLTIESFGTKKRIIGGIQITGWIKDHFNGYPCISAEVPKKPDCTPWAFTDLFINGQRAEATRYPQTGTLRVKDTEEHRQSGHFAGAHMSGSSKWVIVNKEDLVSLSQIENAMIHYYHYWIDEHSPIDSYDPATGRLEMRYRSRFSLSAMYELNDHGAMYYYLTNVPNSFGTPNSWYLDAENGKVYYMPSTQDFDMDSMEALIPTCDSLFYIEGHDVRLRNLELTCTSGDYASMMQVLENGFELGQTPYGGDLQSMCWAPGAIQFENAVRCSIADCYIHGLGIHGIEIKKGCSQIQILDNCISDISAGGVKIDGGEAGCAPEMVTANCQILRNTISHCSVRYKSGCGILVINGSQMEIGGNEVYDIGYSGIAVGFEWGYVPSATFGNFIRDNYIHDIGGELSDMGGIYLLGPQEGTVISGNRIHDVKCAVYGAHGIYLDEGSSGVIVENNVVYQTQSEGFFLHYGTRNVVRNNIIYGDAGPCARIQRNTLHDAVLLEQNIFLTKGTTVYGDNHGIHTAVSSRNILWDVSNGQPVVYRQNGEEYTLDRWQSCLHQDISSVVSDPGIPGLEKYDFTLTEDSAALKLGFRQLPDSATKQK